MRLAQLISLGTAMVGIAASPSHAASLAGTAASADTTVYQDPETGFTFSQYFGKYSLNNRGITFRIAIPSGARQDFDVVIQIVAPSDVGWAGLAWGGGMLKNPLATVWGTSNGAMISSRWADGHYLPQPYEGTTYEILRTGTRSNGTHWQVTAKCTGCTSFGPTSRRTWLYANGSNRLAFAYSAAKPQTPSSNESDFTEHSVIGYWSHDFSTASNQAFTSLVARNLKGK